jgi:hypothetical protein
MGRWLILASIFGYCVWTAGSTTVESEMAAKKLLFEQAGPRNSSLRPFSVEMGRPAEATRDIVFVTPETYENVFSQVKRVGHVPPQDFLDESWTFHMMVTSFQDGKPNGRYVIDSDGLISVIRMLRDMFSNLHEPIPEWLVAFGA